MDTGGGVAVSVVVRADLVMKAVSSEVRCFGARSWFARGWVFVGALACVRPASAQDISIGAPVCRQGVHVVARNARAQDVLQAMSTSLRFQLNVETNIDSIVNIDSMLPMSELIQRVLPLQNLIISQSRDPSCPGSYRIARVWVLRRVAVPPPYVDPSPGS
jgi:hypothetical protein